MATPVASPWHAGERAVQERVGERELAEGATGAIRRTVPPVAAEFLAEQPMIVIAAVDGDHRPWASVLHGEPGFLAVPHPDVLRVRARPSAGDPLATVMAGPISVGTIAIEPATRRRTRLNGRALPTPDGLHVQLDQIFANCPKYIQRRDIVPVDVEARTGPSTVEFGDALTDGQQRLIAGADTMFLGTADGTGDVDASHRGGNPGFVEVVAPDRLRFGDYKGNSFYMTLGNLEQNPAIGMLFIDWATGSTLQLTGTAVVRYEPERGEAWPDGALRLVDVTVDQVVGRSAALPLRGGDAKLSSFNPATNRSPT